MESEASAADQVAQVDPEVDRIGGLITVTVAEGKVLALVTSRRELPNVRRELVDWGVLAEMLEMQVIEEVSISYPITDERLARWVREAEQFGAMERSRDPSWA